MQRIGAPGRAAGTAGRAVRRRAWWPAPCSARRSAPASRCPDCDAITTPEPPRGDDVAELLEDERRAVQVDLQDRRRRRLRRDTPAAWISPVTSPSAVAFSTSACTDSREDTSTVATLTSYPALPRVSAAAMAFSSRRSASRTCLPTPTRRAIACPIRPGSDDDDDVLHGVSLRATRQCPRCAVITATAVEALRQHG